ncbi:MAG: flagellar basal body-associated FliL family protein [Nitrospirae bacterium]|nr:flagellar basal body-associated FliL family protein [Nitrospirota bacterium]
MAEEKDELQVETPEEKDSKKKLGNKKLIIIIVAASVVLGAGGFAGYKLLASKGNGNAEHSEQKKGTENSKTAIVALDPFVLNLSEHGRYLKITLQFEITDKNIEETVKEKTPQLRDTIITLVSSKSLNSISSPEGKFQLKDEILFRANQIMGMEKEAFKNLYFTEFVMQ